MNSLTIAKRSCQAIRGLAVIGALSACGGGSGGGGGFPLLGPIGGPAPAPAPAPAAPPAPAPVAVAGRVIVLGPVSQARVCIDRNGNSQCDADEPQGAPTSEDGTYSFSYTPADGAAAQALAAAPLLAEVAGSNPSLPAFTEAFKMTAPAGRRSQINPLTTLLQAGVAGGLSLEKSESVASVQLGLPLAQFYDYQHVPQGDLLLRWDHDVWTLTALTADALHEAARQGLSNPLRVVDPASDALTPSDQLVQLSFGDPSNYYVQRFPTDSVADPVTGRVRLTDAREGRNAGNLTSHAFLYPTVRLGSQGWVRCDETAPFTATLGSPSLSDYCGDSSRSVGYALLHDVSGQKMLDVINAIVAGEGNTLGTLNPASALADPAATFPAGSQVRFRRSVELTQPMTIQLLNDGMGFATLEAFIAGSPNSAVNLANGAGTRNLGLYGSDSLLRFASTGGNGVAYYRCTGTPPNFPVLSDCVSLGAGTWRFVDGLPGGVRAIEFPDAPQPTPPVASTVRYYAEFEGAVYTVRRTKPDAQYNIAAARRLNGVAWEALKVQLGLGAP